MARDFSNQQVVNLSTVRQEKIEEKRREYERVVFKSSFGVFVFAEETGLNAIEVVDISESGMQFQTSDRSGLRLQVGDVIPVRFYFAVDHYVSIDVKIARAFTAVEDGNAFNRYGCLMDQTMASYAAVYHFVQFIAKCAEYGHRDTKHLKVYY